MDFLVVVSPSHQKLYEQFFLQTLPTDAVVLKKDLEAPGDGAYHSQGWQKSVVSKLRWTLEHAEHNPGSIFALSDVDIQFFAGFRLDSLRDTLQLSGMDILFQREMLREASNEVNTGFYIARSTPFLSALLRDAIRLCEGSTTQNDQIAVNALLKSEDLGRHWGFLPPTYYARSHGFPPRRDIILHHANVTYKVPEKTAQLQRVRRLVAGGWTARWSAITAETIDYALSGRLLGMIWRRLRRRRA